MITAARSMSASAFASARASSALRSGVHERCFAPAAGEFGKGQCWLKYQEDPTNPHVNAFGAYSEAYRATHPAAPDKVDWVAGALVNEGETVSNGTWSSRSHWRR